MAGDYVRRSVAEFVGTFALIFIGAGSVIYGDIVGVALAHGLVIAVMVSAVGLISGGFFNPAITIAFLVTRRIAPRLAGLYLVVQLVAATLAALLLRWVLPANARSGSHLGAPLLGTGISSGKGVAIEAVLTFFLVWVVFTIALDALMGLGLTGAAVNPARAFGPQLVDNHWGHFWVWYVGPIAGGAIAALVYEALYLGPPKPEPVGPPETGVEESAPGTAALE